MPSVLPGTPLSPGGTTPYRRIVLEVDGAQSTVLRPTYRNSWGAPEIGKADGWVAKVNLDGTMARAPGHINTLFVCGDAWVLKPYEQQLYSILTPSYTAGIIPPSGFTTAPNISWRAMYRPPTDLPGVVDPAGPSFTTVAPAMRRTVPAGQPWDHPDSSLPADTITVPPPRSFRVVPSGMMAPSLLTDDPVDLDYLPVDRVAVSNAVYEPNMGFGITFGLSNDFWSSPTFLRFYFGGPTLVQPAGDVGGQFCLVLMGSGHAILYEKGPSGIEGFVSADWLRRMIFQWAEPQTIRGGSHTLVVWPMARDRILFETHITDNPTGPGGLIMPPAPGARPGNPMVSLYRDTPGQTGHLHRQSMTGAGPIRLDIRRDYRSPVAIWLLKFPPVGQVVDQPFMIPHGLDAGDLIQVFVDGFSFTGAGASSVVCTLHDADTGVALSQPVPGTYLAHQGQSKYYAVFGFFASTNQNQTPVLFGYRVLCSAAIQVRDQIPVEAPVRDGSVTGPDIQPGHGSASVNIRDRKGTFSILRKHDRRYCRLRVDVPTTGPSGDPRGFVIIHEGETWQPKAQLRGRERLDNRPWWNYQVPMIDMWYRIQKQFTYQLFDYQFDPNAPDAVFDGGYAPWVIMAVIRDLLHRAGVPYDEIDAPGWDDPDGLRLWWSPNLTRDDYMGQPGVNLALLIKRLAFDTLGKLVIRDPNVGDRGMWRVIDPPASEPPGDPLGEWTYPLANSLANFYVRRPPEIPGIAHRVVEDEGALDLGAPGEGGYTPGTFVKDESYFVYPQAPEGTALYVQGVAELNPKDQGRQAVGQWIWNWKAVNYSEAHPTADPTSISYMDRWEPLFLNEPMLPNQDAANYLAARIARLAMVGRLWCEWVAPCLFINDPGDELLGDRRRPLRVYDQVTLYDEFGVPHPVMLRSVNPFWRSARFMWAHYSGLFLDTH